MKADILAVLLGKVRPFRGDDEPSAIGKLPVADVVAVGAMGLAGDEQADRTVHGGIDKAIHHYPADHYDWWRGYLGDVPLLDARSEEHTSELQSLMRSSYAVFCL